jgi:hypothetical protein
MYSGDLAMAYIMQQTEAANFYIKELFREDRGTFCITSCGTNAFKIMEEYFRFHNLQEVQCFGSNGMEDKSPLAKKLRLNAYMDDDLHKLKPLVGIVPYLYLYSRGYNERFKIEHGVHVKAIQRIRLWEEFHLNIQAKG